MCNALYKSFFLGLGFFFFGASFTLATPLNEMLQYSRKHNLGHHPYWLRLLKYRQPWESPGQWSLASDVSTPTFFFSENGKTDPVAEIEATLLAMLTVDEENEPNEHAQCRLIARYHWLMENIPLLKKYAPRVECPLFEKWANLEHVDSISLLFASAYMDNPASIYGHILLKINSSGHRFGHELLHPTLNFGAIYSPNDSAFEYVFRGIFGGYAGRLSDERFYNFNHLYGETELRDLWEYELKLTEYQRNRVIYHIWEMLQLVEFDYYFFLDNCAYRLAEILDMAWEEPKLIPDFAIWIIPSRVFYTLAEIQENGESIIASTKLIPSRQRRLQARLSQLSPEQVKWASQIIHQISVLDTDEFMQLDPQHRAKILDVLIDYFRYQTIENEKEFSEEERQKILIARSQLPIVEEPNFSLNASPPTDGSPPARFRLGAGVQGESAQEYVEVGWRNTYHDFLGDPTGHLPNTELVTLDGRLRISEDQIHLQQLDLLSLRALNISDTKLSALFSWSWEARASFEPETSECSQCLIPHLQGAFGKAVALSNDQELVGYALGGFYLRQQSHEDALWRVGYFPTVGLVFGAEEWRVEWRAEKQFGLNHDEHQFQVQLHSRYTLSQNADLRVEWSHNQENDLGLFYHYYY